MQIPTALASSMTPLFSDHWLLPELSWLEKILRPAVVYIFILIAFRLLGKRQVGQMTKYDLIVMMMISNVLQNAMIGPDNSVLGAMIGAATILLLNAGVGWFVFRSRKFEHWIEGSPTPVIFNGQIIEANLRHEQLSRDDLLACLRRQGIFNLHEVKLAVIEDNGSVAILKHGDFHHPPVVVEEKI